MFSDEVLNRPASAGLEGGAPSHRMTARRIDTLSGKTPGTPADYSAGTAVRLEYENDSGGLARTVQAKHGIQKVAVARMETDTRVRINGLRPVALLRLPNDRLAHRYRAGG
jgi:hypothetical protein